MSREGKSYGGFPARNDERNHENRTTQKRNQKTQQRHKAGDVIDETPVSEKNIFNLSAKHK